MKSGLKNSTLPLEGNLDSGFGWEVEPDGNRINWLTFAYMDVFCKRQKGLSALLGKKKNHLIYEFSQPCCLLLVIKPVVLQSPGFSFRHRRGQVLSANEGKKTNKPKTAQ